MTFSFIGSYRGFEADVQAAKAQDNTHRAWLHIFLMLMLLSLNVKRIEYKEGISATTSRWVTITQTYPSTKSALNDHPLASMRKSIKMQFLKIVFTFAAALAVPVSVSVNPKSESRSTANAFCRPQSAFSLELVPRATTSDSALLEAAIRSLAKLAPLAATPSAAPTK